MAVIAAHVSASRQAFPRGPRTLVAALVLVVAAFLAQAAEALTGVDLSTYKRVVPEPTRFTAPAGNLLAQEARESPTTRTPTASTSSVTARAAPCGSAAPNIRHSYIRTNVCRMRA